MPLQLDLRIVELLCSRLCHDLVGPVGAINNGIELLEDFDPAMAQDVMPLLTGSAKQAWRRLDFFRIAFGFGGGRAGWPLSDLKRHAGGLFEEGKVRLDWPADPGRDAEPLEARAAKLLLNMILLASEALHRGGAVTVGNVSAGGAVRLSVTASGPVASLHERVQATLDGEVGVREVEARTVQAYFALRLAEDLGASLRCERGQERLTLLAVAD